jgi:CRP-like cAMP-binding protein
MTAPMHEKVAAKSFLERLDDEAKRLLLAVGRPISHARGNRLVRYGEPARGAYVLNKGSAEATVLLPGGEKLVVATLDAGAVFGETEAAASSTNKRAPGRGSTDPKRADRSRRGSAG